MTTESPSCSSISSAFVRTRRPPTARYAEAVAPAARPRRRRARLRRRGARAADRRRALGSGGRDALPEPRRTGAPRARPGVRGDHAAPARRPRGRNPARIRMILREAFDYRFSRLDPTGDHIDPPSIAVYETLVAKGPDGRPRPLLARDWHVSDDGLEVSAATAAGRALPFRRAVRRASRARRRSTIFASTRSRTGSSGTGIRSTPSRSSTRRRSLFRLRYPYARLPSLLWGTHSAVYDEAGAPPTQPGPAQEFANGTGPFRLVSWSPERVVAERVPDDRRATLDRIEWISLLDEQRPARRARAGRGRHPPRATARRGRARARGGRLVVHEQPQAVEHVPRARLATARSRLRRPARPAGDLARRRPGGARARGAGRSRLACFRARTAR